MRGPPTSEMGSLGYTTCKCVFKEKEDAQPLGQMTRPCSLKDTPADALTISPRSFPHRHDRCQLMASMLAFLQDLAVKVVLNVFVTHQGPGNGGNNVLAPHAGHGGVRCGQHLSKLTSRRSVPACLPFPAQNAFHWAFKIQRCPHRRARCSTGSTWANGSGCESRGNPSAPADRGRDRKRQTPHTINGMV